MERIVSIKNELQVRVSLEIVSLSCSREACVFLPNCKECYCSVFHDAIPVAERLKARVYARSFSGIKVSNPARGRDVYLL
jgi:hypothetical protein